MNLPPKIALVIVLLLTPVLSHALEGKVTAAKSSCDYFVIETVKGSLLVKKESGSVPKKGDRIDGYIETLAMTHIRNIRTNETIWIYIDNRWISKEDARSGFKSKCRTWFIF